MARLLIVALLALGACTQQQRIKLETGLANALVSERDEKALGDEIHKEIERQGIEMVRDPVVQRYVEGITERLVRTVKRKKTVDEVHVHVLDAPDQVNAFATPGGHLFVFSGLLLTAEDEAEVAGVLAHEIGHIAARHPARRMVVTYGAQTVAALALGKDPALLEQIAAQLVGGGLLASNSRAAEDEADSLGIGYVHRAGWDPRGLVRFFKRLRELEGETPAFLGWLSTHPTPTARIEKLRDVLRARGWEGGATNVAEHRKMQQRLQEDEKRDRRGADVGAKASGT